MLTGTGLLSTKGNYLSIKFYSFENHWIFWVGPITGGIMAAFCHDYIFSEQRDVQLSIKNMDQSDHAGTKTLNSKELMTLTHSNAKPKKNTDYDDSDNESVQSGSKSVFNELILGNHVPKRQPSRDPYRSYNEDLRRGGTLPINKKTKNRSTYINGDVEQNYHVSKKHLSRDVYHARENSGYSSGYNNQHKVTKIVKPNMCSDNFNGVSFNHTTMPRSMHY